MWICPVCQKENIDNAHVCVECNQGKLCYCCASTFSGDVCNECGKDYSSPIWLTEEEYSRYIAPIAQAMEEKEEVIDEEVPAETTEQAQDETIIEETVEKAEESEENTTEDEPQEEKPEESEESSDDIVETFPTKKRKGLKIFFWTAVVLVVCAMVCGYVYHTEFLKTLNEIPSDADSSADISISSSALSDATVDSSASFDYLTDSSAMSDATLE